MARHSKLVQLQNWWPAIPGCGRSCQVGRSPRGNFVRSRLFRRMLGRFLFDRFLGREGTSVIAAIGSSHEWGVFINSSSSSPSKDRRLERFSQAPPAPRQLGRERVSVLAPQLRKNSARGIVRFSVGTTGAWRRDSRRTRAFPRSSRQHCQQLKAVPQARRFCLTLPSRVGAARGGRGLRMRLEQNYWAHSRLKTLDHPLSA